MKHNVWPLFSSPLFLIETDLKKNELKKLEPKLKKEKTIHSPINKLSENPKQNSFNTSIEGVLQKEEYETLKDAVVKSIRCINDNYFKYKTNFMGGMGSCKKQLYYSQTSKLFFKWSSLY